MATPFQAPAWTAAAVSAGRFADATVRLESEGRQLVLPALQRRLPGGLRVGPVSSMPLGWGFGGAWTPRGSVTPRDVSRLCHELTLRRVRSVVLRPDPRHDAAYAGSGVDWSAVRENCSYEVDLAPGWAEVSRGFSSSVRRAARKAEKSGVEVERRTDAAALAEFLRLYALSVRRWSSQSRLPGGLVTARSRYLEPPAKYQAVQSALGEDCGFWVARHAGVVVAVIVVVSHGAEHAYWRGAMDADLAGPVRANDLLHVTALEDACTRGGERYAMGLTAPDSGLARFKRGFGASPRISHEYGLHAPWEVRVRRASRQLRARLDRASRDGTPASPQATTPASG